MNMGTVTIAVLIIIAILIIVVINGDDHNCARAITIDRERRNYRQL